jgi:hypothetical protein
VRTAAVIGALAALAVAGSTVGTSRAAFTAHDRFTTTVSTAADWVAPALTLTSPATGSYQSSTSVTLAGAAGNATGDATTVTVDVYAGAAVTGTPALTRSVTRSPATWSTVFTGLAAGTYTARATQTDTGGNTAATAATTFTIDTTPPTRVSLSAANGTGTAGHLDAGDTITFTYSEPMLPSSILASWAGATPATVKVRFFNAISGDSFTVLDGSSAANVKLDAGTTTTAGVSLGSGGNYVTNTVTFAATMQRSSDGASFVVTLGAPDLSARIVAAAATAKNMTWTPKAGPTDLAANALASTAAWPETDSDRDF